MFASPARRLLIAAFIVACTLLLGCNTTPPADNTSVSQTPSQPATYNAPAPTNLADGKQTTGEPYEGFLDQADCNTVWGWAWNRNKKNNPIFVEILSDGVPVSTLPASEARWSVGQYTGDDGYHGFVYTVHSSLKDGKPHVITARVSKTDSELQNGPKTIMCSQ